MSRYAVIDVETPNRMNKRISAIGVTLIQDGEIAGSFYSLVDPESDFDAFNIRLTGIDEELVRDAPSFPELWPRLAALLEDAVLVAHNAVFDLGVLRRCLADYEIQWKQSVPYLCTVQMGRRLLPGLSHKLDDMCRYYCIPLQHHHAGSDSRAAAELLLRYQAGGAQPEDFLRRYALGG